MLDEICLRFVDWASESFSGWFAPWKIRLKRSAVGFRIALILSSMKRTAVQLFSSIAEADEEDSFLQRLIQDPIEPVDAPSLKEKVAYLLMKADALFSGRMFTYLLLMTMVSACLLAGSGARSLAVMAAFFCLNWLAEAFAQDYEPVCGGIRQRYLASVLLRAGAYLALLLDYFAAYAADGLQLNVVLQGAMILMAALHAIVYLSLAAFNRKQQLFLRVLCGVLGMAPALACASGIALGASMAAREAMLALSGLFRTAGVTLAFASWEIGTIGELSGGRLGYFRLWQNITGMLGFFMMLLGAFMCAQ